MRYNFWGGQMRLSRKLEGTRPLRPPRFLRPWTHTLIFLAKPPEKCVCVRSRRRPHVDPLRSNQLPLWRENWDEWQEDMHRLFWMSSLSDRVKSFFIGDRCVPLGGWLMLHLLLRRRSGPATSRSSSGASRSSSGASKSSSGSGRSGTVDSEPLVSWRERRAIQPLRETFR